MSDELFREGRLGRAEQPMLSSPAGFVSLVSWRWVFGPWRRRTPSAATLVMAAVVALVSTMATSNARAMQLTPSQKTEMKQHYDRATRAYDVQKYPEAVDEYQKAYEIGGDPAMLYNVAQSYRLNDQLPDALRFYRRYLQRSPNARNREDVERKISDLERTVEERRKAAAAVPVAPVAPTPVAVVAPVAPTPPPAERVDESSSGTRLVMGIVVASVGAAGLITFGVTGKLAKDKGDALTRASQMDPAVDFDQALERDGKLLNSIAITSAIIGGAALVAGGALIVMSLSGDSREHEHRAMLTPVIAPGMTGAAAVVRF